MQKETQSKAIAGAVGSFLAALLPMLMFYMTGQDVPADQFVLFSDSATILGAALVSAGVGWVTVYFAPRNKPVDGGELVLTDPIKEDEVQ